MKIKLDENLPGRLAISLKAIGHDVHTVQDEGLLGHADRGIWQAAQSESRFLITQDMDFSDSRKLIPGSHHGILVVRLHSPNRRTLIRRVLELFQSESAEQWTGCFVVASERKIRILRPKAPQNS